MADWIEAFYEIPVTPVGGKEMGFQGTAWMDEDTIYIDLEVEVQPPLHRVALNLTELLERVEGDDG